MEGKLYKKLTVAGHEFELRYGYYSERERELCPPVVLFPDLRANPLFAEDGHPLVTQIQDPCHHFSPIGEEAWCGECAYFGAEETEIGTCRCPDNKEERL